MAKWDLSKLPEGRKPLPDEWFAERAQMQDRIKELEAELAECEARLSKAMSFAEGVVRYAGNGGDDYLADQARATIEKLKEGGKDE